MMSFVLSNVRLLSSHVNKLYGNVLGKLPVHYTFFRSFANCNKSGTLDEIITEILDENEPSNPKSFKLSGKAYVFIIHPFIKWGPKKKLSTSPDLQLEEAVAMVNSIPHWRIMSTKMISLLSFDKKTFFNKGQLNNLVEEFKKTSANAVFINVKTLIPQQHSFLERIFGVPVFDRYSIIINIFKLHATSTEAKLQVALAEIPYKRSIIKEMKEVDIETHYEEFFVPKKLKALSERELQIKQSIAELRKNKEFLRSKRKLLEFPIVAIVGYTNAGKTSLIKCLTEDKSLKPEDKLFSTLDVSMHLGCLPSNLKVLYVDTIGFFSDIPTELMEPFIATLEDAFYADLIVHVQDLSHPNICYQNEHVNSTLKSFKLSDNLMKNVIIVGNKVDKLKKDLKQQNDIVYVSCKNKNGIMELKENIEEKIINILDIINVKVRTKNGGNEYTWLHKHSAVSGIEVDMVNPDYVVLDILITKAKFGKFKYEFVSQNKIKK